MKPLPSDSPRASRSRGRSLARIALAAGLPLALLGAAPALAQSQPLRPSTSSPGGQRGGPKLTPAQEQQLFPERRRLALEGLQARQQILQQQQQCVTAASTMEAFKGCMRQEREAMARQRDQQRQALQQLFKRYGIPVSQRLLSSGRWVSGTDGGSNPAATP